MIDKAKQLREPILAVAWAMLIVQVVLAWLLFARTLGQQQVAAAAVLAGSRNTAFFATFVILLLAMATLLKPPTKRARGMVLMSGHLLLVSAASSLAFLIMSLTAGFDFGAFVAALGGLLDVGVKTMAALALYWIVDWGRQPSASDTDDSARPEASAGAQSTTQPVDAQQAPVWSAQQAMGLQWQRAGDAASGVAGEQFPPAAKAIESPAGQSPESTGQSQQPATQPGAQWPAAQTQQPATTWPESQWPTAQTQPPAAPSRQPVTEPQWPAAQSQQSAAQSQQPTAPHHPHAAEPQQWLTSPSWATAAEVAGGQVQPPAQQRPAPQNAPQGPDWTPLARD